MQPVAFAGVFLFGSRLLHQTRSGYARVCQGNLEGCRCLCRECSEFREPEDRVAVAKAHLARRITVAASPLRDGQVRWCALDVDRGTLSLQEQRYLVGILRDEVRHFFPEALVEFSGKKGYHIWLLLDEPVPATAARGFLLYVARKVGESLPVDAVEVFPKQIAGAGNVLKLPLSMHRGSGRFCPFVNDSFRPERLEEFPLASARAFMELTEAEGWVVPASQRRADRQELPPITADPRTLLRCAIIRDTWRRQLQDARHVGYDEWFRWIVLPLVRFEGGDKLIHHLTARYPGYDEEEVQRLLEYIQQQGYAPPACLRPGEEHCPAGKEPAACGLSGRHPSPVRFALSAMRSPATQQAG